MRDYKINQAKLAQLITGRSKEILPERMYNDYRNKKKIGFAPIRIGVLDIETSSLNAAFGQVICAVIKAYGPEETKIFRIDDYAPWKAGRRADDSELIKAILAYLEDIDIVIAYNGAAFDIPYLKTRALIHGYPPVIPLKIIDPLPILRRQFRFGSNRLDNVATILKTEDSKTKIDPLAWAQVIGNGNKEFLDQIVYHCEADVEVLDEVAWKMRKYVKTIDVLGSWRQ